MISTRLIWIAILRWILYNVRKIRLIRFFFCALASSFPACYNGRVIRAGIAQLVEHLNRNQRVEGSSPFAGLKKAS